jgi:ketosteroid isomerase-like protein
VGSQEKIVTGIDRERRETMQKATKAVGSLVRPALGFVAIALLMLCAGGSTASRADEIAALDTLDQKAVKNNDVATMDRILSEDFVLVTGKGRTQTKADLLKESSSGNIVYEHQEDANQAVRAWGNTAVVTAFLRAKGTDKGKAFDYKLWCSDVYVRTPAGWRYVFGQASLPVETTP